MLLPAFEALVEHVDARLTSIGSERAEVMRHLADPRGRGADRGARAGSSDDELWRASAQADLLCAPSLAGRELRHGPDRGLRRRHAGVASNIAGYADVVSDGVDGVLVPPAEPQRLAEELQSLSRTATASPAWAPGARESAQRYAWPRVAERIEGVYERAISVPAPATGASGCRGPSA